MSFISSYTRVNFIYLRNQIKKWATPFNLIQGNLTLVRKRQLNFKVAEELEIGLPRHRQTK